MVRLHFHTDCDFFAGCESMLVNFWSSSALRSSFDVSFSYRYTDAYERGLRKRAHIDFPVYALGFLSPTDPALLPSRWPAILRLALSWPLRLFPVSPLLIHEILILRRLFQRLRPDIVHINNGNYPGALSARAAAIAARLAGVQAIIMVVNNLAGDYSRPRRWLDYPFDRLVVWSVSRFVTGSAAAADQLRRVLRLGTSRCLSLHNGIAARPVTETPAQTRSRLEIDNGIVAIGIVAVLRPNKGHRVLIEALARLRRDAPSLASTTQVLIEGEGPNLPGLQRLVGELGLAGTCRFVGVECNVMNFIAAMDLIVLPSIGHEDFPNVVIEAMRLGKPVIASRIAGTPEQVIDGVTGLLVPPGDPASLAAAMHRLATDASLRKRWGDAGAARFNEHFTAELSVLRYLTLYRELLDDRR